MHACIHRDSHPHMHNGRQMHHTKTGTSLHTKKGTYKLTTDNFPDYKARAPRKLAEQNEYGQQE